MQFYWQSGAQHEAIARNKHARAGAYLTELIKSVFFFRGNVRPHTHAHTNSFQL